MAPNALAAIRSAVRVPVKEGSGNPAWRTLPPAQLSACECGCAVWARAVPRASRHTPSASPGNNGRWRSRFRSSPGWQAPRHRPPQFPRGSIPGRHDGCIGRAPARAPAYIAGSCCRTRSACRRGRWCWWPRAAPALPRGWPPRPIQRSPLAISAQNHYHFFGHSPPGKFSWRSPECLSRAAMCSSRRDPRERRPCTIAKTP